MQERQIGQEHGRGVMGSPIERTKYGKIQIFHDKSEPVAQRQEMVSGTLALLSDFSIVAFDVSRASAPKEDEVL